MKIIFYQQINLRKLCIKKLSKYVTVLHRLRQDKILIVLSATTGGVSIVSFSFRIASASFTLIFSLAKWIIKTLLITRKKKKKHDKILMLAKSKLISIDTLVSQALIDMEISHKEFVTILNERNKYEKMKENLKNVREKQENMRLNSVNSKTQKITSL